MRNIKKHIKTIAIKLTQIELVKKRKTKELNLNFIIIITCFDSC